MFHNSSFVSVVFDFNASFNDALPVSPMLLSFDLMRMKKRKWIVDGCHLCVVSFCSLLRSSIASVVFDFNASLSDVAPVYPMLLSDDLTKVDRVDC